MKIRNPAVAGSFYPANKKELETMIGKFLKNAPSLDIKPKSLIVPHAGCIYSGQVAAHAYSLLKNYKKQKIILLGPSHFVYFNDVAADANDYWETPLGKVKLMQNNFLKIEEAHVNEHCLEVQLPFLQKTLENFEILPLVAGDINPKEISERMISLLNDDTMLIISSDLSHYNNYETAAKIDKNTISAIQTLDYSKAKKEADACGKIPIMAAMDIAKKLGWRCKLLEYKNSGDVTQNKSAVVGYASFAFY